MNIIVQKFGGTSVRDAKGRNFARHHIQKEIDKGNKVVAVVSAMGRKGEAYATDTLLNLVDQSFISNREYDLLLTCGEKVSTVVFSNILKKNGIKAIGFSGPEAGIITNEEFSNAKIIDMKCQRIIHAFSNHDVVVVAGFQGLSKSGSITTLGRGGSDTSASALGVALNAKRVDIFTDVEGIMTADPRVTKKARPLTNVTYQEICNLANQGAKVIHPRAVEIAMQANIPIRVRSTYSESEGTLVSTNSNNYSNINFTDKVVTGIAHVSNLSQIQVLPSNKEFLEQNNVFKILANAKISIDFINISPNLISFTVKHNHTEQAASLIQQLGYKIKVTKGCTKIAAVGAGMAGVPGVTAKIVNALSSIGINILQSADSHHTIWVLVKDCDLESAINALHEEFELG